MPATQTTTLGRRWLLKMAVFTLFCAGFAAYALYDATIAYPARGARAASLALFNYLDAVTNQGSRYADIPPFEAGEELTRLRKALEASSASGEDRARYTWLEQTALIGKLNAPETGELISQVRSNPRAAFEKLRPTWQRGDGKKVEVAALSWYDIPVQWLIFAACAALTVYLAGLFVAVARRRYGWDPAEQRLFLPDGSSIVPGEVEEFDKRRWDKFLIFLKIKAGHPVHGGRELKLDLYRHHPLEDWVLQMERTAFSGEPGRSEGA
jgi:hypothetical protein